MKIKFLTTILLLACFFAGCNEKDSLDPGKVSNLIKSVFLVEEDGDQAFFKYSWDSQGRITNSDYSSISGRSHSYSYGSNTIQMTLTSGGGTKVFKGKTSNDKLTYMQLGDADDYIILEMTYDSDGCISTYKETNKKGYSSIENFWWLDGNLISGNFQGAGQWSISYGGEDKANVSAFVFSMVFMNYYCLDLPFLVGMNCKNLPTKMVYKDDSDYDEVRFTYLLDDYDRVKTITMTRYDTSTPFSTTVNVSY